MKTTTLPPEQYFSIVRDRFRQNGDPDVAFFQMKYMRNQFDFFGLKMPAWMALARGVHNEFGLPDGDDLKALARLCYDDDHREMQFFALETVQKMLKKQPPEFIEFLEELILEKSWWDTVDWLSKLVGLHFRQYPSLTRPVTERWMASDNIWLQRVSLIFQLLFKEKTDASLMFDYIRRVSHSKEFFLQKGAAWALRQYSKTDPEAVRAFIESTPLAPLTRREGMKWILKKNNK